MKAVFIERHGGPEPGDSLGRPGATAGPAPDPKIQTGNRSNGHEIR